MIDNELVAAHRAYSAAPGPISFLLPGGIEIPGRVQRLVREGAEAVGVIVRVVSDGEQNVSGRTGPFAFIPASTILAVTWGDE